MRKFKFNYLFAAAMMLGSGMAIANELTIEEPNVYNTTEGTGTPSWSPLPVGGVSCNLNEERICKAFQAPNGDISNEVKGYQN